MVCAEIDLDKGPPLGSFRFADQVQAGFGRSAVRFAGVADDAGADNVLPSGGASPVAGNDMIQIQIFAVKNISAILAGVPVALKNIVPGELDLLLWQPIEHDQQDDARHADFEGDGMDAFGMRFLPASCERSTDSKGGRSRCPAISRSVLITASEATTRC